MSILQLKKELEELKGAFITKYEPVCRVFILDENMTAEGLTAADVEAYSKEHPHTHVVTLLVKDMGVSE